MDNRPLLAIGCLTILGGTLMAILFGAAVVGIGGDFGQGEDPHARTEGIDSGPVDAGSLSNEVPTILKELFKQAGGEVGVPAALLAAVSNQECNRVWQLSATVLQPLITNNEDFPLRVNDKQSDLGHMGCAYDNGSNVWGPMQFQYMTFFGFPRCRGKTTDGICPGGWQHEGKNYSSPWAKSFISENPTQHPTRHPQPLAGTNGDQAGQLTGKKPASIISLKDAVYAAAVKLRSDAGRKKKPKSASWSDQEINDAACRYFGKCQQGEINYRQSVFAKYLRYKTTIDS